MQPFPLAAPPFNGNSRVVPAGNAFDWLRQGWALFVVNPGVWIAMTIVLLVVVFALNIVPLVGTLAANLLTPLLGAGVLLACQKADSGQMPEITDLFAGFKRNTSGLLVLGVIYMAAMLLILVVVVLLGGAVWPVA